MSRSRPGLWRRAADAFACARGHHAWMGGVINAHTSDVKGELWCMRCSVAYGRPLPNGQR